jgi:hypothetical protein
MGGPYQDLDFRLRDQRTGQWRDGLGLGHNRDLK